jgi:hypothetical protein
MRPWRLAVLSCTRIYYIGRRIVCVVPRHLWKICPPIGIPTAFANWNLWLPLHMAHSLNRAKNMHFRTLESHAGNAVTLFFLIRKPSPKMGAAWSGALTELRL